MVSSGGVSSAAGATAAAAKGAKALAGAAAKGAKAFGNFYQRNRPPKGGPVYNTIKNFLPKR